MDNGKWPWATGLVYRRRNGNSVVDHVRQACDTNRRDLPVIRFMSNPIVAAVSWGLLAFVILADAVAWRAGVMTERHRVGHLRTNDEDAMLRHVIQKYEEAKR